MMVMAQCTSSAVTVLARVLGTGLVLAFLVARLAASPVTLLSLDSSWPKRLEASDMFYTILNVVGPFVSLVL